VELDEFMTGMAYVGGAGNSVFNASDTGYLILTPVTPGAGFTTASGLTYATSPETPEPATIMMVISGIVAIAGLRYAAAGRKDASRE
jgi:hypothetical protein